MGEYICGECGHQFCPECVVFPFGMSKPPACISCALELGGVRRQATGRPKLSRKSIKERLAHQKELARQAELAASSATVEVSAEQANAEADETQWLDGAVEADQLPGGWKQSYP